MVTKINIILKVLVLIVAVDTHNILNIIPDVINNDISLRGCKPHVELPVWCEYPSPLKQDDLKGFSAIPQGTKCAFKEWLSLNCQGCHGGQWYTTDCQRGSYKHKRPKRPKRFFFFLALLFACIFICGRRGRSRVPPPTITCNLPSWPIYADERRTGTRVYWKTPTGRDGSGRRLWPKKIGGYGNSGWTFYEGDHRMTYRVTDSRGRSDTCSFSFEVKVHRCVAPMTPWHARRNCDRSKLIWGDSCRFSCYKGYKLEGANKITCHKYSHYDRSAPNCVAKTCTPPLRSPANGKPYTCSNGNRYRSSCTAQCKDGYKLLNNIRYTRCLHTAVWKEPLPTCIDYSPPTFINCPKSSIIVYAEPRQNTARVSYGNIKAEDNSGYVTVTQIKGLPTGSVFPEGVTVVRYKATDATKNEAMCSFNVLVKVIDCNIPTFDDENVEADCPDGNGLGYECKLSCNQGQPLNGSETIECQRETTEQPVGYWNNSESVSCTEPPCLNLTAPENGALACDGWVGGNICMMQCQKGYDIPRSVTATDHFKCGDSGRWIPNNDVPNCFETRRPDIMLLPIEYYFNGDCSNVTSQEEIKTNFITSLKNSDVGNSICSNPTDCNVAKVTVDCGPQTGRRKRNVKFLLNYRVKRETSQAIVTIEIQRPFSLDGDSPENARKKHEAKLKNIGEAIKLEAQNGVFDNLMPGMTLDRESVEYGYAEFECPEGQLANLVTVSCRGCPTGMMYNTSIDDCSYCQKGFYQDEAFSLNCKECPEGTSTLKEGSRNESSCLAVCSVGERSPTGLVPCSSCSGGYYQDVEGSTACKECPPDTSSLVRSTKLNDCQEYDLVVQNEATLQSEPILSYTSDFSLIALFKLVPNSDDASASFWLKHGEFTLGSMKISKTLNLSIIGQEPLSNGDIAPGWNHVVVVWIHVVKELYIFVNGQVRSVIGVDPVQTEVGFTLFGATMGVSTDNETELHLRSYKLIAGLVNTSVITQLSSSCKSGNLSGILDLKDLQPLGNSTVYHVVPSVCDAVDECLNSPCNGHQCTDTQTGFTCQCLNGFTGETCDTPPDYCQPNPCYQDSTCRNVQNHTLNHTFVCDCADGFRGKLCDDEIVNGGWGNWTEWSQCTVTCGGGQTQRTRDCDNPAPDSDGKPCVGAENQTESCNEQDCPECRVSDFKRAFGSENNCVGDPSWMACNSSCRPGYYREDEAMTNFNCSGGVWLPSSRPLPCRKIKQPSSYEIKATAQFDTVDCSDKAAVNILKNEYLEKMEQSIQCAETPNCKYNVEVAGCDSGRVRREAGTKLLITLSMDVPPGDIGLAAYQINGTVSDELKEMVKSIQILESSALVIQNKTRSFIITINGVEHQATAVEVTGQPICSVGFISTNGMCVECPPGTYSDGQTCVDCEKGYYQDKPSQTSCIKCPPKQTTLYISSTEQSLCIVDCPPGTNIDGQSCVDCEKGYYQDEPSQTSCIKCPPQQTTLYIGSTEESLCIANETTYEDTTHQDSEVITQPTRTLAVYMIVGIVVGVVFVVMMLIGLGCFIKSRLRQQRPYEFSQLGVKQPTTIMLQNVAK